MFCNLTSIWLELGQLCQRSMVFRLIVDCCYSDGGRGNGNYLGDGSGVVM